MFDHLDKAFCVLKLDNGGAVSSEEDTGSRERGELTSEEGPDQAKGDSKMIRRVDLIVAPSDQYPFALVSWTGSKVFTICVAAYTHN